MNRKFYNKMEIQRADGFVVQTGDPEGPSEVFVDPETNTPRTIPLEIKVRVLGFRVLGFRASGQHS